MSITPYTSVVTSHHPPETPNNTMSIRTITFSTSVVPKSNGESSHLCSMCNTMSEVVACTSSLRKIVSFLHGNIMETKYEILCETWGHGMFPDNFYFGNNVRKHAVPSSFLEISYLVYIMFPCINTQETYAIFRKNFVVSQVLYPLNTHNNYTHQPPVNLKKSIVTHLKI